MTKLTSKNTPLIRMTGSDYRGRNLVVTLFSQVLTIRRAGMRSEGYTIGYDAIYEAAAKMYARALLAEGGAGLRSHSKAKSTKLKAKAKPGTKLRGGLR